MRTVRREERRTQASQVADRFHLVLNLSAAIERVFEGRSRDLMLPVEVGDQPKSRPSLPVKPASQPTRPQQRRQRCLDRYQQVAECYRKGYSKLAMARELAVSIKTVHRWLRRSVPERKPPAGRKKKLAEFAEYLEERWNSGCHHATWLFQEIRARGYRGSRQMVGLRSLIRSGPLRSSKLAHLEY